MTPSALGQILRTIPELQELNNEDLGKIAALLKLNEYKPGALLWRNGTRLHLLGIVDEGTIIAKYRQNRSIQLSAGDFFRLEHTMDGSKVASVRAGTDIGAKLYVLDLDEWPVLSIQPEARRPRFENKIPRKAWTRIWTVAIAILIVLLVWQDMGRILSGALYLASKGFYEQEAYEMALNLLECAAYLPPERPLLYNRAGYVGTLIDDSQLAESVFAKALTIDQANGAALNNLAAIYFDAGKMEQSLVHGQKAAEFAPNAGIVKYNLGIALAAQEHWEQAIHAYKEATRIEPDWSLPYLHQSVACLQLKDYEQAEAAARIAAHLDPSQQAAHLSMTIALYHQGQVREALAAVEQALSMRPNDMVSMFYKFLILRDLGEMEAALEMLEQLDKLTIEPHEKRRIEIEIELMRGLIRQS